MKGVILKQTSKDIKLVIVIILLISVFLITLISSFKKDDYASIIKESRDLITKVMTQEKIPGLAIAIIDKNKIIWTEGFGYTDFNKERPVTPETIFSIQSMSKTITATTEMIAVQDGLIDLDKPISTYLPSFTVNSRFDEKPQEKITIRRLLSHTAGFTQEAPIGNNIYPETPSFEAHIKSISDTWLRYPVGQRYSYSNLGIDLSGYILQIKSGKLFPDYVKEKLLDPIEMKTSTFDIDVIKKNPNRAIGHSAYSTNVPLEVPMIPSGGFYSNVFDLSKFVQFHLNRGKINGKSILSTKLLDEMYTIPYPVNGQYEGYALGIVKVWNDKFNVFYYNHGGGGFGFLANIVWYPDYGTGLIILTNSDNNTTQNQLTNQILDLILKSKQPKDNSALNQNSIKDISHSINLSDLKKYAGGYLGRNQQLTVTVDNPITFLFDNNDSYQGKFISSDVCQLGDKCYKFTPANKTSAYIVRTNDGISWDYNDGPNDQSGLAKKEWENYIGKYTAQLWGQTPITVSVGLINGYLYCTDPYGIQAKLIEYKPGLFFTSTGECLDFRGETPMVANIHVQKVN